MNAPLVPAAAGAPPRAMVCPECGEPAVARPPRTLLRYAVHGMSTPAWSHRDGEPLCPVMGAGGYRPAEPVAAETV